MSDAESEFSSSDEEEAPKKRQEPIPGLLESHECGKCKKVLPAATFTWYAGANKRIYRRSACAPCYARVANRQRANTDAPAKRATTYMRLPEATRLKALQLYQGGVSLAEIGRSLKIPAAVLRRAAGNGDIYDVEPPKPASK